VQFRFAIKDIYSGVNGSLLTSILKDAYDKVGLDASALPDEPELESNKRYYSVKGNVPDDKTVELVQEFSNSLQDHKDQEKGLSSGSGIQAYSHVSVDEVSLQINEEDPVWTEHLVEPTNN